MAIRPGACEADRRRLSQQFHGIALDKEVLYGLAELARKSKCHLLVDEAYASLTYDEHAARVPSAASLGPQVVVVSSMSKVYGVPGIRIGWLCTTDAQLQLKFLAAKEQMCIGGSVLDDSLIAEQILARSDVLLRETRQDMQNRLSYVEAWVERQNGMVEWVHPQAGVMGLMRVRSDPRCVDGDAKQSVCDLCAQLLAEHGVYVGPRRCFEREEAIYFRLGSGWPMWYALEAGLKGIAKGLRSKQ
ncbi:hypothetical protein CBER1_11824 [Cercospora berteroae]|uniref:Aminotransferase class I/classII large domain-containing protein n=1 Tax=Cercospora berteroae TaxID=357750 RepID=A0A2S6C0G7_9PEZI|nr:hypothetical protein CBER1_11824 [Cercospora berteroae]